MNKGKLLDARPYVEYKIKELKERVKALPYVPKLMIVRVGSDYASERYIRNKIKKCEEVGIISRVVHLSENITQEELEEYLHELNESKFNHGILLQLPLPKHLDERKLVNCISPEKDVDGFTDKNLGKLMSGQDGIISCTPRGIIDLLDFYNIPIAGKDVLIINRSNIVGKPLAHLFLHRDATVTIAHSKTAMLYKKVWNSDIVVTAIGKPNFFTKNDFCGGAIDEDGITIDGTTIIDVAINFDENGKICGDVKKSDYAALLEKGCNITPVPNGVGAMTVISLLENVIETVEKRTNDKK